MAAMTASSAVDSTAGVSPETSTRPAPRTRDSSSARWRRSVLPELRVSAKRDRGAATPNEFANGVERERYAGFHLVCGESGGVVAHVSSDAAARVLEPGIFAVSNAKTDIDWPKIAYARQAMQRALGSADIKEELMRFLTTPRSGKPALSVSEGSVSEGIESEVFVSVPEMGYGTRASTVVLVAADGAIDFRARTA